MTHGFTSGKLLAQQALIERTGVGEFVEYNDGTDTFKLFSSDGSPEGVIAADKGSQAADITNGALYIKTTDTANTGWLAASTGGGGGGWVYLSTATISGTPSSVDFTSDIDSTYNAYAFVFDGVLKSAKTDVGARTSTDGGSTWDSTSGDYYYNITYSNPSLGSTGSITNTINIIERAASGPTTQNTTIGTSGIVYLMSPATASRYTYMISEIISINATPSAMGNQSWGVRTTTTAVDAIQFLPVTGTYTAGTIRMYGVASPS